MPIYGEKANFISVLVKIIASSVFCYINHNYTSCRHCVDSRERVQGFRVNVVEPTAVLQRNGQRCNDV